MQLPAELDEWPPVQSLSPATTLPGFPVWALPPKARAYAEAAAKSASVPVDMMACLILVCAAAAVQRKVTVRVFPGWTVPTNLYLVIALPPGERKSAAVNMAVWPYKRLERDIAQQMAQDVTEYNARRAILERAARLAEEKAGTGKGSDEAAIEARRELDELEPVIPYRLFFDDVSLEALTSLLAQHGSVAHISAEGGLLGTMAGRYNNLPNLDAIKKAWDAEEIRVDRKGRKAEYIDNPAVSIGLCVQPVALKALLSNPVFRGEGVAARFLICLPESKLGTRPFRGRQIPDVVRVEYEGLCYLLMGTPARELTLSPDALGALELWHDHMEPQMMEYTYLDGWASKLEGTIARIAGILHCMSEASDDTISAPTMDAAVAIGNYFLAHARAAYDQGGADALAQARHLWDKICEMAQDGTVNKRLLYNRVRGTYPTVEAMDETLEALEALGYIRQVESTGRGRHSITIQVNPAITEGQI